MTVTDKMEYKIDLGRERGHTAFEESDPKNHAFVFNGDFKLIPYGDREIIAYRQTSEKANTSKSIIKVLGIIDRKKCRVLEEGQVVSVPVHKVIRLEGFDDKEQIERVVRREYGKTEEDVDI